jgi:hypothetical protein
LIDKGVQYADSLVFFKGYNMQKLIILLQLEEKNKIYLIKQLTSMNNNIFIVNIDNMKRNITCCNEHTKKEKEILFNVMITNLIQNICLKDRDIILDIKKINEELFKKILMTKNTNIKYEVYHDNKLEQNEIKRLFNNFDSIYELLNDSYEILI